MPERQGQTGQVKKIKLESDIQQVYWTRRAAAPGGSVGLEVFTHHVGNNSELKIELTDKSGKGHGNFTDKIHGNHFWAPVKVPVDAREELYATVKLSKHGLSQKSGPLIVLPAVQITNPKWDKKEARRGDILKLTVDVKGVPDGIEAMIEIWEHDADGAHDFITKFPAQVKNKKIEAEWEYEYHEDSDEIPADTDLQPAGKKYSPPEYFFRVRVGEIAAESGLLEFKDWVELTVKNAKHEPMANRNFTITFADGRKQNGSLDADGHAKIDSVPPGPYVIEVEGAGPLVRNT